ncbi:MAG: hypothetical protein AAFP84_07010, partial [Actinomycetota bacterium]
MTTFETDQPTPTDGDQTGATDPTGDTAVPRSGSYRLLDRYLADDGRVFVTGVQALARLPLEQLRADRAVGLNTAALASGYPGSPLGGIDGDFAQAAKAQPELPFVLRPAVNEELAATTIGRGPAPCRTRGRAHRR